MTTYSDLTKDQWNVPWPSVPTTDDKEEKACTHRKYRTSYWSHSPYVSPSCSIRANSATGPKDLESEGWERSRSSRYLDNRSIYLEIDARASRVFDSRWKHFCEFSDNSKVAWGISSGFRVFRSYSRILLRLENSARIPFASVRTIALFLERRGARAHARDLSQALSHRVQAELFARRALRVSMHPRREKTCARVNAPVCDKSVEKLLRESDTRC